MTGYTASNWWLRSANTNGTNFRNVNNNGNVNNNNANNANGVAVGSGRRAKPDNGHCQKGLSNRDAAKCRPRREGVCHPSERINTGFLPATYRDRTGAGEPKSNNTL